MGWNDRLPEDPYLPDQQSYENWQEYHQELLLREELEAQTKDGPGISSQNIDPGAHTDTPAEVPSRTSVVRETLDRFLAKFIGTKQ